VTGRSTEITAGSARRWLGLTATPYCRDKLDGLIAMQVGPAGRNLFRSKIGFGCAG
jgi:superfamily II DNA or RNA helicase